MKTRVRIVAFIAGPNAEMMARPTRGPLRPLAIAASLALMLALAALLALSRSASALPISTSDTARVALLAEFDDAWAAGKASIGRTFGTWVTNLSDSELQQLAELAVNEGITDLDSLTLDPCFRELWATGRSSLLLRAESYMEIGNATAQGPVETWQSVETASALLTGAARLQLMVDAQRREVECIGPKATPSPAPTPTEAAKTPTPIRTP